MEISLTKLPWYAQVGAFVALAAGAVGAFYVYYEKPVTLDMVARQAQLKEKKGNITIGLATAKKLDEFRREVDELEERLSNLKAYLPEEKDAADLLRSMQTVAVQSSLTIKGFKPSVPITQEMHAEWPIALELDGTYHNLAIFFDRVGKFTRIVNISGVVIQNKANPTLNSTITAKCVATTFVLLDPNAPPPKAKGKPAAKPATPPAPKKAA